MLSWIFSESCVTDVDTRSSQHLDDFAKASAIWIAFWAVCYILTNDAYPMLPRKGGRFVPKSWVSPKRTDEYASRVISTLHAVLSVVLCGLAVWKHIDSGSDLSTQPCSCTDALALSASVGYFSVDFIGIIVGSYYDFTFLMHHAGTVFGIMVVVLQDSLGFHMVSLVMWMEISNPAMHLRWLLQEDGHHHTRSLPLKLLSWSFLAVFGVARFVVGPYLWVTTYVLDDYHWLNKVIGVIMFVVSLHVWVTSLSGQLRGKVWTC